MAFAGIEGADQFGNVSIYRDGIGRSVELLANRDDFTRIIAASVAINDLGDVLFAAPKNGSTAISSVGNSLINRIIGSGDLLDGIG